MKQPSPEAITELETLIEESGGTLNPELVVAQAHEVRSALHGYFEWSDTEAARQYRLDQARKLIRVWVTVLPQKPQQPIRVMVSLRDDRGVDGYRPLVDVMGDADLREKLLEEAKRDMNLFRRKYSLLAELAGVFAAMDEV